MPTDAVRTLSSLASLAWIVVGGYGLWGILVEDTGDNWQTPYLVFASALLIGAALTVAAVWIVSRRDEPSTMRVIGLGVCVVGLLSTLVAWALPLWMTLLAIGFAVVAVSGQRPWQRPVALLAGAQLLGMAAMIVGIAVEVGRRDEYGDHPVAGSIGLVLTAGAAVVSLYQLDRSINAHHAIAGVSDSGANALSS
jgi:hypothetical protein